MRVLSIRQNWPARLQTWDRLCCLCDQVLPGTDGETTTQGLDNLPARVSEYYKQVGARACKLLCTAGTWWDFACTLMSLSRSCRASLYACRSHYNALDSVRACLALPACPGRAVCKVARGAEDRDGGDAFEHGDT